MTLRVLLPIAALAAFVGLASLAAAHHSPVEDIRPLPKPDQTDPD